MYRLFTLREATRLLPVVDEHLGALQSAASDLGRLRERLAVVPEASVEGRNLTTEVSFLLGVVHTSKAELDRLGVRVRDIEEGIVDFPSQLGAEVVVLSWERGQDAITHYRRLNGDAETRLLPNADSETQPPDGASA